MTSLREMDLSGKRVLVTGAGVRVGRAIALAFGARGARVALHYNSSSGAAEATAQEIRACGGDAELFRADLYDRNQVRGLARDVLASFGGLDIFVASAANFDRVRYDDISDEIWDRALALNVTAPALLARALTPALRESKGSMVFISCTSASKPYANYLPYVVSKAAVRQLMRALALELAPAVRVNAVAPGTVEPPEAMGEEERSQLKERLPLKRLGHAEDVARAVVFAATSRSMTGSELVVDGGRVGAGNAGEGAI